MFIDPYATTRTAMYKPDAIKKHIKISVNLGNPFRLAGLGIGDTVMALTGPDSDIPPFAHPLILHGRDSGLFEDSVAFDARGFVKVGLDGTVTISSKDEFELHLLRARLTRYVLGRHYTDLSAVGSFPLQVFVHWLSNIIVRRLAVDPGAHQRTMAIVAIYYISLFKDINELTNLTDSSIAKTAQIISSLFRIDATLVVDLLKTIKPITTLMELIETLKEHGGSERYENLNIGFLYTITSGSWFGAQASEVVAVALEHPPTWIALVATALKTRTFRKSAIGETVEREDRRDIGKDYLRGLYRLPGLIPDSH